MAKGYSPKLLRNPLAQSTAGLERLKIGMRRILSVLEKEEVSAIRTLEMKISDSGPKNQRVEPHILGLAGQELVDHHRRVVVHRDLLTGTHNWYAPARFSKDQISDKLESLVSAYLQTVDPRFTAALGDPLEISVYKTLLRVKSQEQRLQIFGNFDLSNRKPNGRFSKTEPPDQFSGKSISGPADFVVFHPSGETLSIECKNLREWIYPSKDIVKQLILKAVTSDTIPVLIGRRIPYITKMALCAPAGIIAHETYHQLYPDTPEGHQLAQLVAQRRGLGYHDVKATEKSLPRTITFFEQNLPRILSRAAERFRANHDVLREFAESSITWRELLTCSRESRS